MQIGFRVFREIEIDHHIDRGNIDPSRTEVRRDQAPSSAQSEVMEYFISGQLVHFGVNKVTGVVQLGDFLGQELYAQGRITKNDGLLHMELVQKDTF